MQQAVEVWPPMAVGARLHGTAAGEYTEQHLRVAVQGTDVNILDPLPSEIVFPSHHYILARVILALDVEGQGNCVPEPRVFFHASTFLSFLIHLNFTMNQ